MKILYLFAFLLFFLGCHTETKVFISPEYDSKKIKDVSMIIDILDTVPTISFEGKVPVEFGTGDQNALIYDFIKKQLRKDILKFTGITKVDYANHNNTISYSAVPIVDTIEFNKKEYAKWQALKKTTVFQLDSEGRIGVIPAAGTVFEYDTFTPDFVLLLSNITIGVETNTYTALSATSSASTTVNTIICKTSFIIWDNKLARYVSYGRSHESNYRSFPQSKMEDWYDLSHDFTEQIVEGTPFYKDIDNDE